MNIYDSHFITGGVPQRYTLNTQIESNNIPPVPVSVLDDDNDEPTPTWFTQNISNTVFMVILFCVIILYCSKIEMALFRYISMTLSSIFIDKQYGISIGILMYVVSCSSYNIYNICLAIITLVHIFVCFPNMSESINYLIEVILFISGGILIYYTNVSTGYVFNTQTCNSFLEDA